MTERELLEAILEKAAASEAKIMIVEAKFDEFVKEYKDRLKGFARDKE